MNKRKNVLLFILVFCLIFISCDRGRDETYAWDFKFTGNVNGKYGTYFVRCWDYNGGMFDADRPCYYCQADTKPFDTIYYKGYEGNPGWVEKYPYRKDVAMIIKGQGDLITKDLDIFNACDSARKENKEGNNGGGGTGNKNDNKSIGIISYESNGNTKYGYDDYEDADFMYRLFGYAPSSYENENIDYISIEEFGETGFDLWVPASKLEDYNKVYIKCNTGLSFIDENGSEVKELYIKYDSTSIRIKSDEIASDWGSIYELSVMAVSDDPSAPHIRLDDWGENQLKVIVYPKKKIVEDKIIVSLVNNNNYQYSNPEFWSSKIHDVFKQAVIYAPDYISIHEVTINNNWDENRNGLIDRTKESDDDWKRFYSSYVDGLRGSSSIRSADDFIPVITAPYPIREHAILKNIIDDYTLVFSNTFFIEEGVEYKLGQWLDNYGSNNEESIVVKKVEIIDDATYRVKIDKSLQFDYLLDGSESIYSDKTAGVAITYESGSNICYIPIINDATKFFSLISHEILHTWEFTGDCFADNYEEGHPHVQDPVNLMGWMPYSNVLRYRPIEIDYNEYGKNNWKYIKQWEHIRNITSLE